MSDKAACIEATRIFASKHSIRLLVNSAVYFGLKGITAENSDWERSFAVNVIGYANTVQAVYEYMKDIEGDKSIVNIAI